jgi:small subunit ribosomal protein S20
MPNLKSAKKELRKTKTRTSHNNKIEEDVKTLIKKSRKAITTGDAKAGELIGKTMKALDKAAQKGIIKKNTRDRNKSRLQANLNKTKK